jgi:hypothetical protein
MCESAVSTDRQKTRGPALSINVLQITFVIILAIYMGDQKDDDSDIENTKALQHCYKCRQFIKITKSQQLLHKIIITNSSDLNNMQRCSSIVPGRSPISTTTIVVASADTN